MLRSLCVQDLCSGGLLCVGVTREHQVTEREMLGLSRFKCLGLGNFHCLPPLFADSHAEGVFGCSIVQS